MAYPISNDYKTNIYSGESDNRLRLKFNGVEVENANECVDKVTIKSRVMANGSKRFSLGDFISKEVEIVMHDFDVEEILDPVEVYIGTKVGENYEDVKIGVFNIQSKPLGDDGKINLKLRDNSVKLDFPYNAKPLMDINDGVATKRQILEDIGTTFGVPINVPAFRGENEEVGIYDNTINGRTYVSYLAEQAGKIAQINRDGAIVFVDVKNLKTWVIDPNIVESFKENKTYKISKTIYEDAIRKYVDGNDTHDKLFLDSANPYISTQEQVEDIHLLVNNLEISSFTTGKVLGNPAIDPWDLISITWEGKTYVTFANSVLTYEINMIQTFDTQIGEEEREENVTIKGEPSFRKWAKATIDNIEGTINLTAEKITDLTDFTKNITNQGDLIELPNTPNSNGAIRELRIKNFQLMELYPGMAYPSNYTFPGVLNFYTLIFDTVSTFNNEPNYVFVNSPIPLQKLGSVYDELIIEANKVKVIQRIGYDFDNEKWSVLSTPITHELNDVLLPTFDGDTYISVKYFDNLIYNAEYLIKNDLTSNFATQLESSSQFKLNQNEIEAKVSNNEFNSTITQLANGISSKVSKGEIVSEINQSEEEVKIEAQKIKLEGLTTINNNFMVRLDGSIEARDGVFSGNIYLPDGGEVISEKGIYAPLKFNSMVNSLGFMKSYWSGVSIEYMTIDLDVYIPEDFIVDKAYLTLTLFRTINYYTYVEGEGQTETYGQVNNIEVVNINTNNEYVNSDMFGVFHHEKPTGVEITNVFGNGRYSAPDINERTVVSRDISDGLRSGLNSLTIRSANNKPPATDAGINSAANQTQMAQVNIIIFGFTK